MKKKTENVTKIMVSLGQFNGEGSTTSFIKTMKGRPERICLACG